MKLQQFRKLVESEFGSGLTHATPANVREFLDRMQIKVIQGKLADRLVVNESATSYEEIIKDFFSKILEAPTEEAIVVLWSLALDLSFAAIEYQHAEHFSSLFRDMEID